MFWYYMILGGVLLLVVSSFILYTVWRFIEEFLQTGQKGNAVERVKNDLRDDIDPDYRNLTQMQREIADKVNSEFTIFGHSFKGKNGEVVTTNAVLFVLTRAFQISFVALYIAGVIFAILN